MSPPIRTKSDEAAVDEGCYYDPDGPKRVKSFITQYCHLSKGEWGGKLIKLIPWQEEMIDALYGWYRKDGTRRFRTGYVQISKKNAKSSLESALGLYHTGFDQEPGAEVVCAARNRTQAGIIYQEAANMVLASPALKRHLKVVEYQRRIIHQRSHSVFKALSADAESHDGINMSYGICDELHRWTGPKGKLYGILRYAGRARRQPMLLSITTAGRDRNSVCFEQYKYSKAVLEGAIIDPSHYVMIYEADPKADWRDQEQWKKANPALGYTIKLEDMIADAKKAERDPSALEDFLQLQLGIWMNTADGWIKPDKWAACGQRKVEIPLGSDIWVGLDLSNTLDISACNAVAPVPCGDQEGWAVLPHYFLPEDQAEERNQKDNIPYMSWAREGHIQLTPGDIIDYERIRAYINKLGQLYNVREVWIDKYNATNIATNLMYDGFKVGLVSMGVGTMNGPLKEMERLIFGGLLFHNNCPVTAWMANNVVAVKDSMGNIKLDKEKSAFKIDGIVAIALALGAAKVAEPEAVWDGCVQFV